jgi:hypothetical protein
MNIDLIKSAKDAATKAFRYHQTELNNIHSYKTGTQLEVKKFFALSEAKEHYLRLMIEVNTALEVIQFIEVLERDLDESIANYKEMMSKGFDEYSEKAASYCATLLEQVKSEMRLLFEIVNRSKKANEEQSENE